MTGLDRSLRDDFTPRRVAAFLLAIVVAIVLLPLAQAEDDVTTELTAKVVTRKAAKEMRDALPTTGDRSIDLHVEGTHALTELFRADAGQGGVTLGGAAGEAPRVVARIVAEADDVEIAVGIESGELAEPVQIEHARRKGTWVSILPPLLAILVALCFRRLVLGLLSAVWLGGTLMVGDPLRGAWIAARDYIYGSVADAFSLYILAFTLLLVGMVQLVNRMGGIAGILETFGRFTATARSTRVTTALLGLAIFFDDYANTVVVGTSMRPVTDERRISREKLAYLVDSMSAPIAGIAIISTWVGYEVGLFGELAAQLALDRSGYDIFFSIIPLRFYCLFTIVFVFACAAMGRDYGPMLAAERRAQTGEVLRAGSRPLTSAAFASSAPSADTPRRWYNGVLPIATVLVVTFVGMFWSGWSDGEMVIPPLFESGVVEAWRVAIADIVRWEAWRDAFSSADGAKVLFWSAVCGSVVAFALAMAQRLLTPREALTTMLGAVPAMKLAIAILILAWSIRAVCDDLGTSIYLLGAVHDVLAPAALPVITFLLAAVVAFATGTSWGTMGILLPAMVPVAFYMTDGGADGGMILLLCFGAVLDGAIFGDHCSPLSDTTVMSSLSASCDHLDHVRTQMPYAVTTMTIAAAFGYVGVAIGLPVAAALGFGGTVIPLILWLFGRPAVVAPDVRSQKPENAP